MAAMRSWARPCIGAGPWNEALVGGARRRRFFLCELPAVCAASERHVTAGLWGEQSHPAWGRGAPCRHDWAMPAEAQL